MPSGDVLVIARTLAEAHAATRLAREGNLPPDMTLTLRAQHEGRALRVYTMAEIVRVLAALEASVTGETHLPGSEAARAEARASGTPWAGAAAVSGVQRPEGEIADRVRSGHPLAEALTW